MLRHRRTREVSNSLSLLPRRCHFFKIILQANIRYRQLRIPRKFIREFRDELSDIAVLKVPSGKIWSIGLRKSNREVWFDKGWQEFVEYHSIFENHFLVFRYDGNSNFYVCIFDTTACEIEYPCDTKDYEENNPKGGCQIEEMEDFFDVPPRPSQTTVTSRKVMSDEPEEQWMAKSRGGERSGLMLKQEKNENIPYARRFVHAKDSVSKRPILAWERERQLQAATAFKSTNPFCTVKMQPSYVSGHFILNVPRSIARTFITETHQEVTLQVPDGGRWHMYCHSVLGGSTKIFKGWKVFVQENNLEEGDICIFELVKKSPTELKVFIYRFTETVAAQRS